MKDVLCGFHWPITLISHLHLHVIAPETSMNFVNKNVIFSKKFFFGSVESAIEVLEKSDTQSLCDLGLYSNDQKYFINYNKLLIMMVTLLTVLGFDVIETSKYNFSLFLTSCLISDQFCQIITQSVVWLTEIPICNESTPIIVRNCKLKNILDFMATKTA